MTQAQMSFKSFAIEYLGSSASWRRTTRRFIAQRLLSCGIKGAKGIEVLALWIDPTLERAIDK